MQILLKILIAVIGILAVSGFFFFHKRFITLFNDFKKWARRNKKKVGAIAAVSALTLGAGIYAMNIIPITKALHLDSDRNIISDIYDQVKAQDDIWSEKINHGEYVRVTFEEKLANNNDITIYVRNKEQSNTVVQVFLENSNELIASFPRITYTGFYKIYLTNMIGKYDIFDLRIWNLDGDFTSFLEFDYIVDPDWWNTNWNYSKKITIDHNRIDTTLTNFPILVYNVSSDYSHAQSDGDDFLFVDSTNTTQYSHEIEDYNSTTNTLVAWVNVTSLSSIVDTIIWMYYGNATCSNQEDRAGTWNSDYIAVWHMNDADTGITDSKHSYNSTSVETSGIYPQYEQTGKIGYCVEFDGQGSSSQGTGFRYADTNLYTGDLNYTQEAWINTVENNQYQRIFYNYGESLTGMWLYSDGNARYLISPTSLYYVYSNNYPTNTWFYLTATYHTSTGVDIYNNSVWQDNDVHNGTFDARTDGNAIGFDDQLDDEGLDGFLDELRVSSVVRNTSWINASYHTMNMTTSFLTVGSEQTAPSNDAPIISNIYPSDGGTDIPIVPTLHVQVNDTDGNSMTINWYEGNYTKLTEVTNWDDVQAFQGVALDDTYFYTLYGVSSGDGNTIYKHWKSNGTLKEYQQYSKSGDLFDHYFDDGNIINDHLYITGSNYSGTPAHGMIYKIDLSDLSMVEYWNLSVPHYPEGIDYYNGYFWVCYGDWQNVTQFDSSFNAIANYSVDYAVTFSGAECYQGLVWYGTDIFMPIHGGGSPHPCVDRYHWNGSGFEQANRYLYSEGNLPDDADQGIAYDKSTDQFWIAQRNHPSAGQHSITICNLTGWNLIQTNNSVNNGTYYCDFTNASAYNHTYYWNVTCNDGSVNVSNISYFTTKENRYNATIRNYGEDFFVWLGDNTTAYYVYNNLTGFDEAAEYVAILNNSGDWWEHYQNDGAGNNWSIYTFDVVKVYLTDAVGNQTFNMTANGDITYDAPRNVTLIDVGNGYNYTGFTNTTSTTLSAINTSIRFTTYYYCALWNETDFEWNFWFADWPYSVNKDVHQYDVVMTKISTDRWWEM